MSEKARGALFNALGDISQLSVLDAYAGSGALSFEAISRGAERAVAVEIDHQAQSTIAENITALKLQDQVQLIRASITTWLAGNELRFDLVFIDSPYDGITDSAIAAVMDKAKPGGTIVFSHPPAFTANLPKYVRLVSEKNFGDATLGFYKRTT
jgi:16S rRNA (guanine966-N2)-methyltransferase